ncbi:MAG: hypothetical protein AB7V16_12315 [Vulcanibacillus sp.]
MSTVRTYKINVTSTVILKVINKEEIEKMIKNLKNMVREKTDRLNNHLTSCSVSTYNNCIVIMDELNIVKDIDKIAEAYGMICQRMNIDKKTVYVFNDPILEVLKLLKFDIKSLYDNKSNYTEKLLEKVGKQKLDDVIETIKSADYKPLLANKYLNESINKALNNEKLEVEKVVTKLIRNRDGMKLDSRIESVKSDEHLYLSAIKDLNNTVESINKNHKENVVKGTTKSIEVRAKSMGYTVEQKIIENKVQLVLVRSR